MCVTPGKAAGVCLPCGSGPVVCCGAVAGCGRILGHWDKAVPLSRNQDKCKTGGVCCWEMRAVGARVPVGWVQATSGVLAQGCEFLGVCGWLRRIQRNGSVGGGSLGRCGALSFWPRVPILGVLLFVFPKGCLESCEHEATCCFGVMGVDRGLAGS